MKTFARKFNFYETYETASWIESAASDKKSFIEVPWEDDKVIKALVKYSKTSILHFYIYYLLAVIKREEYRDNSCEIYPEEIDSFRKIFRNYEIRLQNEKKFDPYDDKYDENEYFYKWFLYHENSFEILWEKITDEVFHLLFANRGFLLVFNQTLSDYLKENRDIIPFGYRNSNGKILRAKYIPTWAKKAVYFRDQGRCVLCLKDLSGLLSTDTSIHYDHIVPLSSWGVNDPCNLQLLCEKCNLKKSSNKATTGIRYRDWW
jgi:hypothetical protein